MLPGLFMCLCYNLCIFWFGYLLDLCVCVWQGVGILTSSSFDGLTSSNIQGGWNKLFLVSVSLWMELVFFSCSDSPSPAHSETAIACLPSSQTLVSVSSVYSVSSYHWPLYMFYPLSRTFVLSSLSLSIVSGYLLWLVRWWYALLILTVIYVLLLLS